VAIWLRVRCCGRSEYNNAGDNGTRVGKLTRKVEERSHKAMKHRTMSATFGEQAQSTCVEGRRSASMWQVRTASKTR
jgi:hypothetical protein